MTLPPSHADETELIDALRRGDEAAFGILIDQYHASLIRLARLYVADQAAAEDVVQETWLGVLKGIDRFEGISTLKTWLFHILANIARTRGVRESRSIPFSAYWAAEDEPFEPAVDPQRFLPSDHERWPGGWAVAPQGWGSDPEAQLLSQEVQALIYAAIQALPPAQREVITLRDVEGWSPEEICNVLVISETNQRVLLHPARSRVRHALEHYLDGARS